MSDELGAVLGASSMIRTMADGTFRIQIDVEPRFAQQAFALFGSPGTPVALARISNDAAVSHDRAQQAEAPKQEDQEPKGGALAKLAGMFCQQPEFWEFLVARSTDPTCCESVNDAAATIRHICGIESRAELDSNAEAAAIFHEQIRLPYVRWKQGVRG